MKNNYNALFVIALESYHDISEKSVRLEEECLKNTSVFITPVRTQCGNNTLHGKSREGDCMHK